MGTILRAPGEVQRRRVAALAFSLEPRYYVDPAIFAAERDRIFRRTWQLVASERALAAAGDYVATDIAGSAVIILRGDDGEVRALRNVCRHRGSRLLDAGTGTSKELVCPYHGWRYDLRGALAETPWYGEPSPFALDELCLRPLSVATWRGLVFASLAPEASLEAQLGDLPAALEDLRIEAFTDTASQILSAEVNWKAYLDQFVEYYHAPVVHALDESAGIERYSAEPGHNMTCMLSPRESAFGGRWFWAWPNWTLSLFPGGMKTSRVNPLGPEKIEVHFRYFFADTSDAGAAGRQRVMDATHSIFAEDARACARVQLNYSAGDGEPGPLHPRHERALAYFQDRIRRSLAGA